MAAFRMLVIRQPTSARNSGPKRLRRRSAVSSRSMHRGMWPKGTPRKNEISRR